MKTKNLLVAGLFVSMSGLASAVVISPTGVSLPAALNGDTAFLETGTSWSPEHWWQQDFNGTLTDDTANLPSHVNTSSQVSGRIRNATNTGGIGSGTLDFTLGGAFDLDGIILWNSAERDNRTTGAGDVIDRDQSVRGVDSATISISTDGGIAFTALGTVNFTQEDITDGNGNNLDIESTGQFRDFSALIPAGGFSPGVTDVRLELTNHGGGNIVAFDEIAFSSPIPEPSSTMLFGLGALGLLARRRR